MLKAIIAFSVVQLGWCLLLGGYSSQEVTAGVEQAAKQWLPLIQANISGDHLFVIESVQSYETQIVSGKNHKYQLVMVETQCPENTLPADMENCVQSPTAERLTCEVVVYVPLSGTNYQVQKTEYQTANPLKTRKLSSHKRKLKKKAFLHGLGSGYHRDSPVSHLTVKRLFNEFVQRFDRKYSSVKEFRRRRRIFADNLENVRIFQKAERGTARYGVTKFSDLTVGEWRSQYLGLDASLGRPAPDGRFRQTARIPDVTDMPTEFDWRTKGAVTPVKNQGQCGSCWAFSVTGNVEGQYFIKHKELLSLSEQELVDCDTDDHGCQGGLPDQAYKFIEFLGGLETESEYPYEERNAQCRLNRTDLHVKLSGSLDLPKNEKDIQKWLYANGPVSIGVNANPLMFYNGGIIDVWSFLCKASGIDHGVLLVGFGEHDFPVVQKKKPFWIIKNSWGGDWGEQGYFRLIRGTDECGVQDMASSSIVV